MLHLLTILVTASLVAGMVLQDGGTMPPQIELRQALRARQYVLLNRAESDEVDDDLRSPISLLETGGEGANVAAFGGSAESIGQAATLNEAGFSAVASTKSTASMELFTRRLLDSQGLRVKDQAFMLRVLPYYTGECANQSFDSFLNELHRARKSKSCHPAWVAAKNANPKKVDKDYMQPHTKKDKARALVVLLKSVMEELGAKVKHRKVKDMWQFATRFLKSNGTLIGLKGRLRKTRKFSGWIDFGNAAPKPSFGVKGHIQSWYNAIGKKAPLTEFGYQAVVYARDDMEMASFIRRVAKQQNLTISNEGALSGMTPYYSGLCARQSLDALVKELHSLVGQTFAMRFALELPANEVPNMRKMRKMIAKKAGVDVSQVKISHTDINKFKRQLDHADKVRNRKRQRAQVAVVKHGAVTKDSVSSVVNDVAHETVERKDSARQTVKRKRAGRRAPKRKGFEVTISIDSAHAVHGLAQSLKTGAFFEGHSRTTLPKTDEVESSKPTQCGGGLVVPK